MKKYILNIVPLILFGLSGCSISDVTDVADKAEEVYKNAKNEYDEFKGEGVETRAEKPFTVVYQEDESAKVALISANCSNNAPVGYVHYSTPSSTANYLTDIRSYYTYPGQSSLKPYWDIRYVNPVSQYMNGGSYDFYPNHGEYTGLDTRIGVNNIGVGTDLSISDAQGGIVQSECVGGLIAGGTTINLNDAPEQSIYYGGPQSTFTYFLGSTHLTSPWNANATGNLVIQASFDKPLYFNYEENLGGSVNFNVFMKNKKNGIMLNFVIGIYAMGTAWQLEKAGIQYDPTTNIVHVATVIKDSSWWSTKSPQSQEIREVLAGEHQKTSDNGIWPDFYRVNISYQNLLEVLKELEVTPPAGAENISYGMNPEDWEVTLLAIQYELEEDGGKAALSGSFKGFEAYTTQLPI